MRTDQLEHGIRTACQIIGHDAVIVVGAQSILGSFAEYELPPEATMSVEIDILPFVDDSAEAARLADLIEGVAGEWWSFEKQHGFSIDGVDWETAVLPDGWRSGSDREWFGLSVRGHCASLRLPCVRRRRRACVDALVRRVSEGSLTVLAPPATPSR